MIGLGCASTMKAYINKIMSLDFHYLQSSRFFQFGSYSLEFNENKEGSAQKREVSLFDSLWYPPSYSISDLHSKNYVSSEGYFGASLERALDPTVRLPVRNTIVSQWNETYNIVNKIKVRPKAAHFAMQPPGADWKKHDHSTNCKQILTFCYKFDEFAISNNEPSRFIIDNGIEHTFIYPNNKFYYTFRDNLFHKSISNEWRFFWIYDFDQYIDVPDSDFIEMPIVLN
jgi:hypothetical protein